MGKKTALLMAQKDANKAPQKQAEIEFLVGKEKPSELHFKHLFYVGISQQQLQHRNGVWYLILPADTFSIVINTEPAHSFDRERLCYKGKEIASSRTSNQTDELYFELNKDGIGISQAINSMQNLLVHPMEVSQYHNFTSRATGTIQGCAAGIKNNSYDAFWWSSHNWPYFSAFGYKDNTADNKKLFIESLKVNTSLKYILISDFSFDKYEFAELLETLCKHPQHPKICFSGCRLLISKADFVELVPTISSLNIAFREMTSLTDYNMGIDCIVSSHVDKKPKEEKPVTIPVSSGVDARGTIEACANGIKDNLYQSFRLPMIDLHQFNYKITTARKLMLFDALSENTSLKHIKLSCITFYTKDLEKFINALSRHPLRPRVELSHCEYYVEREKFIEMLPKIILLNIDFEMFAHLSDGSIASMKELITEYNSAHPVINHQTTNKSDVATLCKLRDNDLGLKTQPSVATASPQVRKC